MKTVKNGQETTPYMESGDFLLLRLGQVLKDHHRALSLQRAGQVVSGSAVFVLDKYVCPSRYQNLNGERTERQ